MNEGIENSRRPVVVGVADHGGWAILVSVAAEKGKPMVIDRRRVTTLDACVPSQPYHHDTVTMSDDDAEALLRKVKRSAAACTSRAFDQLADDLGSRYLVEAITIRVPPLERLPATAKEAHASYHVQCRADGMLYHAALCEAAEARGWTVVCSPQGDEITRAAEALACGERLVEQFVGDFKATLGPPWSAEHRNACAAAIAELSTRTRLTLAAPGP
jgi:hypothetical protein